MPGWILITLVCAFSLAVSDAFAKRYFTQHSASEILLIRFGVTGVLLMPVWGLQTWPHPEPAFWYWLGPLIPLEIFAMWLYMQAIRDDPLSHTLPYLAFTPVFTILTGYVFLGERISVKGFAGIITIVAATWLLNSASTGGGWKGALLPFYVLWQEKGPRLMLIVAAIYSLTSVMGKGAMQYVSPAFFGAFYYSVVGFVTLVVLGLPRIRHAKWPVFPLWPSVAVSVSLAAMVITHFIALQQVEVAYMIAVKRISLLFGVLLGALWFAEKGLSRNMLVSAMMIAGVVLIVI